MRRALSIVLLAVSVLAPPGLAGQASGKLELGLGVGGGGISPGLAVRGGLAIERGAWGGVVRAAGHAGESTCDPCLFGIPNPEVVREVALLVRRGLGPSVPARVSLGLGVGVVSGKRDDPTDPDSLIDIPRSVGAAYEIMWDFGDRRGWGSGLAVQGNLNGEASFIGVVFFGSVRLGGPGQSASLEESGHFPMLEEAERFDRPLIPWLKADPR